MKLYELKRGDYFKVDWSTNEEIQVPVDALEPVLLDETYRHLNLDGAYSRNSAPDGEIFYLAAWTPVVKLNQE